MLHRCVDHADCANPAHPWGQHPLLSPLKFVVLQSYANPAHPCGQWLNLYNLLCYRGILIVLAVLSLLIMLPTHGVSALSSALFRQTFNISVTNFQVNFLCIILNTNEHERGLKIIHSSLVEFCNKILEGNKVKNCGIILTGYKVTVTSFSLQI
jgi:hypothetical protein